MQLAEIEETLVLTSDSPVIDVRSATVGTNFGSAMLGDVPNHRDISALLAQTPGITLPRVGPLGRAAIHRIWRSGRQVAQRPNPPEESRLRCSRRKEYLDK